MSAGFVSYLPMSSVEKKYQLDSETKNSSGLPSAIQIYVCAWVLVLLIIQLPFEYIDGKPVPTIVFGGRLMPFRAFIAAVAIAFSGSFGAICLHKINPKFARFCRSLGVASTATALAILIWVSVLPWFDTLFTATNSVGDLFLFWVQGNS
ncbi:hypothetical protein NE237_005169 [Protea cynaroides]|uniref:Uncharacterized protein n=1 Tax=Protea cynaroides TaxID=273540 RepID=A0A9Q0QU09_9MAGN|nr:hypothetical protein NE237_005169 [Protea cynaroides]